MKQLRLVIPFLLAAALLPHDLAAKSKSLRGSAASMLRQNEVARKSDYSFLRTPKQVKKFVEEGRLVELSGNADYRVEDASYPFGRPEVKLFVERLSSEYRATCGEQLVVTSVTRPTSRQPKNAHPLSVHPAGMAVDLRISSSNSCVTWLENTLLDLEGEDLLDVTREVHPPHLHVAVFPKAYRIHVEQLMAEAAAAADRVPITQQEQVGPPIVTHTASVAPRSTAWPWAAVVSGVALALAAVGAIWRRKRS
jgi:hypothetical protein